MVTKKSKDKPVYEDKAVGLGRGLVRIFHYIALFAIGSAIVWSASIAFFEMTLKRSASIQDILLLFIYLELGAMIGIYFNSNRMPVRFLIYVAITALTRLLLEYLNDFHSISSNDNILYHIVIVCGGILLLAISVLILRFTSFHYPTKK